MSRALRATEHRWHPGLADALADVCWKDLGTFGLDRQNYGTMRALDCDPASPRDGVHLSGARWGRPLLVEHYVGRLAERYDPLGLRAPTSFNATSFEAQLGEAMALLDNVPGVGQAVRALVWSVIPVDVEGPEYDTGYSDPAVPFSIFIGAHQGGDEVPAIRLAEGILHEAMHLQLSLMEDVVPLIAGNFELRMSPWQRRPRPVQGLLHGLYVFRVVQDWLRAAAQAGPLGRRDHEHAATRLREIERECARLRGLADSRDLTDHGRVLVRSLLAAQ